MEQNNKKDSENKKTILITGGAGFIGHHAIEHLLKNRDWKIVVLDSLNYAGSMRRISELNGKANQEPGDMNKITDIDVFDPQRVRFVWHDLRAPLSISTRKLIGKIDYCVHFAAESHVDRSLEDSIPFVMSNVVGTANLLEYLKHHQSKCKTIIFSTDEVFGAAPQGVYFKEDDRFKPSNPYAAAKAGQEMISFSFAHAFGLPISIVRSMNCLPADEYMEVLFEGRPTKMTAEQVYKNWQVGKEIKALSLNIESKQLSYQKIIFGKSEKAQKQLVSFKTRYGRKFRVTAEHGVIYASSDDGHLATKPAKDIELGEKVPIWAKIPLEVTEQGDSVLDLFNILEEYRDNIKVVVNDDSVLAKVKPVIREMVYADELAKRCGHPAHVSYWRYRQCRRSNLVPLSVAERTTAIVDELPNLPITFRYRQNSVPSRISLSPHFLWLLGLFLAEANIKEFKSGTFICAIQSDLPNIEKAAGILEELGIYYTRYVKGETGAPLLMIHSQTFFHLLQQLDFAHLSKNKSIPIWVKALPNEMLKHFMQGYWDGDGQTGYSKREQNWLSFDTASKKLALDLVYVMARFGIVGSIHEVFHKPKKDSQKKYLAYTVEGFCKVSRRPEDWQSDQEGSFRAAYLKKHRHGDVVLAKIKEKRIEEYSGRVYDFTVEGNHNFSLSSGVIVHNCIGERQHPEKFLPKTIRAILNNEKVILHGRTPEDLSSRCWIHARNVSDGLLFLLDKAEKGQFYHIVGEERTVLEIANWICQALKGRPLNDNEIEWVDYHTARPGHDKRYAMSGEKLAKIGWRPPVGLEASLKKSVRWMTSPEHKHWLNL